MNESVDSSQYGTWDAGATKSRGEETAFEHSISPINIAAYDVGGLLAQSGFGRVYRARRKADGLHVVLKEVPLSFVGIPKCLFVQNVLRLKHPNILQVLEVGIIQESMFTVAEYCNGGSVDVLMGSGRLQARETVGIIIDALKGLSYLHENGIVHGDIKPAHILLTGTESSWTAKITGIRIYDPFDPEGPAPWEYEGFHGTFGFMSREKLINGKDQIVGDIWSTGATLYNMLTGELPRDIKKMNIPDLVKSVLHAGTVPILKRDPGILQPLAAVLDRSIADDVRDRYRSADEMRIELEKVLEIL